MTNDPLVEVTHLLSAAVNGSGDVDAVPAAREEAIAKLGVALRARARSRRRKQIAASCAVAASLLVLVGGGMLAERRHRSVGAELGHVADSTGPLTVVRDGRQATLDGSRVLPEGSDLRTPPNAEARLEYASGTRVTLGGGTHLSLVEQSRRKRFFLKEGTFLAKVSKLGPDERFVVATNDAEVEVRGTEFRVSIVAPVATCGDGTSTRLEVTEGVVVVRHGGTEKRIVAGERWPACEASVEPAADAKLATPPAPRTSAALLPSAQPPAPAPTHRHDHAAAAAGSTTDAAPLAAQNALYGRAVREKNEGRADAALTTLDDLLTTYPQSPLGESARLLRMRILATTDRRRAAVAAEDYLRRYPAGFARDEAAALVAAP